MEAKLHYTKKEITRIKQSMGLKWTNRHSGTRLAARYQPPIFNIDLRRDGPGVYRYCLYTWDSDQRNPLATFEKREHAMEFAEWLLPAVHEIEAEKARVYAEKQKQHDATRVEEERVRAAKRRDVDFAVGAFEALGFKVHRTYDGTSLRIEPDVALEIAAVIKATHEHGAIVAVTHG